MPPCPQGLGTCWSCCPARLPSPTTCGSLSRRYIPVCCASQPLGSPLGLRWPPLGHAPRLAVARSHVWISSAPPGWARGGGQRQESRPVTGTPQAGKPGLHVTTAPSYLLPKRPHAAFGVPAFLQRINVKSARVDEWWRTEVCWPSQRVSMRNLRAAHNVPDFYSGQLSPPRPQPPSRPKQGPWVRSPAPPIAGRTLFTNSAPATSSDCKKWGQDGGGGGSASCSLWPL